MFPDLLILMDENDWKIYSNGDNNKVLIKLSKPTKGRSYRRS